MKKLISMMFVLLLMPMVLVSCLSDSDETTTGTATYPMQLLGVWDGVSMYADDSAANDKPMVISLTRLKLMLRLQQKKQSLILPMCVWPLTIWVMCMCGHAKMKIRNIRRIHLACGCIVMTLFACSSKRMTPA